MSVKALGYLGVEVRDPAAFHEFLTGVLGVMGVPGPAGSDRYRLDEYAWRLQVVQGDRDEITFAGFEVSNPVELDAMREHLKAQGIAVVETTAELRAERGVLGLIQCRDPEGLLVEIYYGATLLTDQPFISSVGISSFKTGSGGLGHIAMASAQLDVTGAFYRDALGFRLTDEIHLQFGPDFRLELEFYHCNSRHHTLAFAPMPAPQRLQHLMFEVTSIDEVGLALDRAVKAGHAIAHSLGRHSNDRMYSFYVVSPAGFQFEFGYGAIEVDDATWSVSRHDVGSVWGHHMPKA